MGEHGGGDMAKAEDFEIFDVGRVELQSGEVLPDARLAYRTYGSLNAERDNVIILPTFYTGTHRRNEVSLGRSGPSILVDISSSQST